MLKHNYDVTKTCVGKLTISAFIKKNSEVEIELSSTKILTKFTIWRKYVLSLKTRSLTNNLSIKFGLLDNANRFFLNSLGRRTELP